MFKKQHVHRMSVVEMKIVRLISWNIRKHRIQNEEICLKIGAALKRWEKVDWDRLCARIWFKSSKWKVVEKDLK